MNDVINLRGAIVSKFGSVSKFAKEIGWCYSKANRIANGKQEPDASDIKDMVKVLNIEDPSVVSAIFLS